MTPFSQTSHRSLAYQFTVNVPLLCPLFSIFRKFLHFQPCFGQNSSSLDPNFSKFSFLRPLFFKENPLPRPYILKPVWHTSTKKKLSAPPGVKPLQAGELFRSSDYLCLLVEEKCFVNLVFLNSKPHPLSWKNNIVVKTIPYEWHEVIFQSCTWGKNYLYTLNLEVNLD